MMMAIITIFAMDDIDFSMNHSASREIKKLGKRKTKNDHILRKGEFDWK
jgi:hypothetical protein